MSSTPKGIVESYENLRTIMSKSSPMSRWSDITNAMQELGTNIYGKSPE